ADSAGKLEIGIPITGVEVIVENAADAAIFVAVWQEEIFVAPGLEAIVIDAWTVVAGSLHGGVEIDGVGIVLRALGVEYWGQVSAAAPPLLAGHDHAGVHVNSRNVWVPRMDDERNARAPEACTSFGAWH